jgi:hypothetical protein
MPSDPVLLERCEYDPATTAIADDTNLDAYFNKKSEASSCYYAPECTRIRDPIRGGSVNPDCLLYADVKESDGLTLNSGQNVEAATLKAKQVQIAYPLAKQGTVKNDVGEDVESNQSAPNSATKERDSSTFLAYQAEFTSLDDYSKDSAMVTEALENIHQANIAVLNQCTILQNDMGYSVLTETDPDGTINKCGKPCEELTAADCKKAARGNFCNYKPLAVCSKDLDPVTNDKRDCGGNTGISCGACVEYTNGTTTVLSFDDPKAGKKSCYSTKDDAIKNDGTTGITNCDTATFRTIQTQPTDFRVEEKDTGKNEWKTIDVRQATSNDPLYACVFGSVDAHKEAIQACKCTDSEGNRYEFADDDFRGADGMKQLAIDVYGANRSTYENMENLYAQELTTNAAPSEFVTTDENESVRNRNLNEEAPASLRRKGYSI